ncbi:hypothetical protein L1987_79578 [Smallanthus sonchifolius]|uniref:Uncharacterized protein n=1 Tax=Smallanthus sonchifolius TaxID=185202 RepID=A0ACB8YKR4_9ASTR|nr:hypothetical protein L1987_79578 [Smallanthus sonchifolius]
MGSGGEVGSNIVLKGLIGMGRDRFHWRPWRYDADQHLSGRFVRLHLSISVSLGLAVSPSRRLDWFNDNRLIISVILNISKCCSRMLCMIGEFRAQSFWVMSDLGMRGRLASWWLTYYMITGVVKSAQENSGLSDGYLGSLGTNADIWKLMELDLAHVKVWVAKKCLHQFFVADWKTHLMRPIFFCDRSSKSCRVHLYRLIIFVLYIGSNRDYPRVIVRLQFRPFLFLWGVDSTLRVGYNKRAIQEVHWCKRSEACMQCSTKGNREGNGTKTMASGWEDSSRKKQVATKGKQDKEQVHKPKWYSYSTSQQFEKLVTQENGNEGFTTVTRKRRRLKIKVQGKQLVQNRQNSVTKRIGQKGEIANQGPPPSTSSDPLIQRKMNDLHKNFIASSNHNRRDSADGTNNHNPTHPDKGKKTHHTSIRPPHIPSSTTHYIPKHPNPSNPPSNKPNPPRKNQSSPKPSAAIAASRMVSTANRFTVLDSVMTDCTTGPHCNPSEDQTKFYEFSKDTIENDMTTDVDIPDFDITNAQKKAIASRLEKFGAVKAVDQEDWSQGEWEYFHHLRNSMQIDPNTSVEDVDSDSNGTARFFKYQLEKDRMGEQEMQSPTSPLTV